MRVGCGFDHAGVPLKGLVMEAVAGAERESVDLGETEDYPEIAVAVAAAVIEGRGERGVPVCGSGAGAAVAATKAPGIRTATVHDNYTAHQAVEHDNVNVLCLGARVIGPEVASELVAAFSAAAFSGAERHVRRLAEVAEIECNGIGACSSPEPPGRGRRRRSGDQGRRVLESVTASTISATAPTRADRKRLPHVVGVGAGFAGLTAAKALADRPRRHAGVRVTLVDRRDYPPSPRFSTRWPPPCSSHPAPPARSEP